MFLTFAIICSSSREMSRLSAVRTSALTTVANDNEDSQEAQGLFRMLQMTMTTAQHHVDGPSPLSVAAFFATISCVMLESSHSINKRELLSVKLG